MGRCGVRRNLWLNLRIIITTTTDTTKTAILGTEHKLREVLM